MVNVEDVQLNCIALIILQDLGENFATCRHLVFIHYLLIVLLFHAHSYIIADCVEYKLHSYHNKRVH